MLKRYDVSFKKNRNKTDIFFQICIRSKKNAISYFVIKILVSCDQIKVID